MLARALSHDLPMGALRDLWLEHADVTDLLAPGSARARDQQVVPHAGRLAVGRDRALAVHQGSRSAPQAVAVRALALVQAAAQRRAHGRADVQRGHRDGQAEASAGVLAAVGPAARSLRHRHRPLRLPAARADPRSADHSRARASARSALPLSAAAERRGHQRFRIRECAGAGVRGARDVVVSRRLPADADQRDGRPGRAQRRRRGRIAPNSSRGISRPIRA